MANYSKIRHIKKSNILLENRSLKNSLLSEYDILDDDKNLVDQELQLVSSDISDLNPNFDFSTQESALLSIENCDVCQLGDDSISYVKKNFGEKIKKLFPTDFEQKTKVISDSINKFIDYVSTLKLSELKSILKDLKNKVSENKKGVVSEHMINEFFGTSMAIITIGSLGMPALVLSIFSVILVSIVAIWLLKQIFCAFNISFSIKKRCRVRSFSWGQCK